MSAQPSGDFLASLGNSSQVGRSALQSLQAAVGGLASSLNDERRRYPRIPLTLQGRYMLADGTEFDCQTLDISPIGIGIQGFSAGAIGERVVAYFEGLGRVEGKIVRRAQTWFAVDIMATPRKLEKLAEKISQLIAGESSRLEHGSPL